MALKIVQTVNAVFPPNNGISTSNPINLKSGYLRMTSSGAGNHIAIIDGNNVGVSSESSLLIPADTTEIIKERVARQRITGITTGSTTIVHFGENCGNPFVVGDHVSIVGAQPSGINTDFNLVTATSSQSITINYNSTAVTGVITTTNADAVRSVKVAVFSEGNNAHLHITEVQISSQA